MTNPKPLVLPRSEYFLIARCVNRQGFPLELGVIVSYARDTAPVFRVDNWKNDTGLEVDPYFSECADNSLTLYNAFMQGDE